MDKADRRRHVAEAADEIAQALEVARAERDRRRAAGEDTAWLDTVLAQVEPAREDLDNIAAFEAMGGVVTRHGPGAWPAEDLAALARVDPAAALRVLRDMVSTGVAEWPGQPPP